MLRITLLVISILSLFTAIFSPILIAPFILKKLGSENLGQLGTVGDYLGGTMTPLLTLGSTIMFIVAILMQREELELQRKELTDTRKEFIQQNQTIMRQRFENTFFHMISLHNEIVNALEIIDSTKVYKGRNSFKRYYQIFTSYYNQVYENRTPENSEQELLEKAYKKFFDEFQSECGHYFRNLYRLYKLIHEYDGISQKEKIDYAGIIRAQLSSYEMTLLLYNGVSTYGKNKFLPLMNEYKTLENLNKQLLVKEEHFKLI